MSRFLAYAGVTQGQVSASPAVMRRVAALPSVAWSQRGSLILAVPYVRGRPQSQVLPWAILDRPPQVPADHRGRPPSPTRRSPARR